ncbi:MAG TPA: nickel pincer cofactor biosynthesis protein LarC [Ktedonobacterales bacterium]
MGERHEMIAYLDCFSGISGDMLLGALLDAGLPLEALRERLATLPLAGYTLDVERVTDRGISGTRAIVRLDGSVSHEHRRLGDIDELIRAADLGERACDWALATFARLAAAEAAIHATRPEVVTFHEVGAVDSIVDIVGTAVGLDLLGVDALYCSELPLTSGRVRSAHGALPVPAPATLELLKGTRAVWRSVPTEGELVTPTGAAVLATLARFERPAGMRVECVGYGFGQKKLPWANCLRVLLGEAATAQSMQGADGLERDEIAVLESNIDNMTGEALGWLMERLLAAGALDVSYTPIQMKKQRPGVRLTMLVLVEDAERLAASIIEQSATLGVRMSRMPRLKAGRREETIETPLGPVRVKLKLVSGQAVGVSPEYDDLRALAEQHGLPLHIVSERVTQAARAHFGLE